MTKVYLTSLIDEDVKIGAINLPTLSIFTLLISVSALFTAKYVKDFENLFFGIFLFTVLISFILGFVILSLCFLRRQKFENQSRKYLRQNILVGLAALTSPVWLIVLSFFITGFNR